MRIALVAPGDTACSSNAGAHLITAGIRHLVRQAVPGVHFVNVEMLHDDEEQWAAASTCSALILCGNPRFSVSAEDAWWEDGIWARVNACADAGVRVIDGWAGACVGLDEDNTITTQSEQLLAMPRTRRALQAAKRLHGAITRDRLATSLYRTHGIHRVSYLPCSSWFARWEHHVLPSDDRLPSLEAAIVLLALEGHEWGPDALRRLAAQLADRDGVPCPFIATRWSDFAWAQSVGLERVLLVTEPVSLLQLYARTERLVSLRIHASIPAASLHTEVCTLAVDSRARACDAFGLPVQPFTDLQSPDFQPCFGPGRAPDAAFIINTMWSLLTC